MTTITKHGIAVVLEAVLVIDMIIGTAIASQPLMTAKPKVTMQKTKTDLDQDNDHNQGPVLVPLKARDTIMVTTFIMMTTGAENGHVHLFLPLAQDQTEDRPLLEPNHLRFPIKIRWLSRSQRQCPH